MFDFKEYKFELVPITDIHIGSGEELDPTEYIVKNGEVYFFNIAELIRFMFKKSEKSFNYWLDKGDINGINQVISGNFDVKEPKLWISSYEVGSDFETFFKEKLADPKNQMQIFEFIKNGNDLSPYIPGSSIKGVIRTALIDYDIQGTSNARYGNQIEAEVLTNGRERNRLNPVDDPFKDFKTADISFPDSILNIKKVINTGKSKSGGQKGGGGRNYRGGSQFGNAFSKAGYNTSKYSKGKGSSGGGGIYYYSEVLDSNKFNAEQVKNSVLLESSILIEKNFKLVKNKGDIISKLNQFYQETFKKEEQVYKKIGLSHIFNELKEKILNLKENEAVVKMGKGAGQNYTSFSFKRYHPKTKNLIDSYPLGWCILRFK